MRFLKFFELIKTVMEINSLAGHFFLKLQTSFFFIFGTVTTQQPTHRRQHWRNQQHNKYQTQTNTNTSPISSTDTGPLHSKWREACIVQPGQLFLAWCEHVCFLHDANMFARHGMSQSTRTPTLSQVRAVCTQREPTGRVIIVIFAEREDKR